MEATPAPAPAAAPAAAPEAAPAAASAAAPAAEGTPRKASAKERRPSLSLQGLQDSTLTTGKTSGRIYGSHSLFLFPVSHPVRRFAIQAIEWKWFDRIVLLLIVTNCVFLAITDPTCPDGCSHRNPKVDAVLMYAEYVFCVLFTVEMTLKVIAEGLVGLTLTLTLTLALALALTLTQGDSGGPDRPPERLPMEHMELARLRRGRGGVAHPHRRHHRRHVSPPLRARAAAAAHHHARARHEGARHPPHAARRPPHADRLFTAAHAASPPPEPSRP